MKESARPEPVVRRLWVEALWVAALFVLVGVVATWPMATDAAGLSLVNPTDNDYRFNLYIIFWGAHALTTDPLSLHHTNMFHPERYTFAYSDMELSHSVLMLPVILLAYNPILTYNLLLLASISIGGLGFYLLCRRLTTHRVAALLGALIYVFNPVHFSRYSQIQMFGEHWLPWFGWALLIWLQQSGDDDPASRSRWKWPLVVAAFFCLTALSGAHPALFGGLLGASMVVFYGAVNHLWMRRRFWDGLLVIGVTSVAVLGPIFWPYFIVEGPMLDDRMMMNQLTRASAAPVELLSAGSRFYRWLDEATGWPSALLGRSPRTYLFPGLVPLLLAAVGVVGGGIRRNRDQLFWLLLFLLALWIALGPAAGLYMAIEKIPVLRLLRVPSRVFQVAAFALAVLSAFGVDWLRDRLSRGSWRPLLAGFLVLFAAEAIYAPMDTYPYVSEPAPRLRFLAEQPGDFAIVEIPLDPSNYTISARQLFNSIHHWKKLLVGYSGFQTDENLRRLERLAATFPTDDFIDELQDLGVRYVIVREDRLGRSRLRALQAQPRLQLVRRFGEIVFYGID